MHIVDTNMILRYVLNDHPEMYARAKDILEVQPITIPLEIVAEVVYVLEKVYHTERHDIERMLQVLADYDNLTFLERAVMFNALRIFVAHRVDFIDAVLGAYQQVWAAIIHTFDRPLQKLLHKLSVVEETQNA